MTAPAGPAAAAAAGGEKVDAQAGEIRSLYLHVPFCERKCGYCDFVSVAGTARADAYVDALRAELRAMAAALPPIELDTVFLGGGTPGLLDPSLLAVLLDEVRSSFRLAGGAEVTIEANPSSTGEARATAWLEAGCTRVSLGVQSLEPDVLAFLGRVHDAGRALDAVAEVRSAGFTRINCDLIYAVPGLDDRRWRRTVDRVLELGTGHVSCYELTVEEGTPLAATVARGRVHPAPDEAALSQHWIAVDRADAAGLRQYEVSALARPGQECRHNLVYWRNGWYLAAGVGAHGHLPPGAARALGLDRSDGAAAVRYWHTRGLDRYVAAVAAGGLGVSGAEGVDAVAADEERVMVGMRLADGVELRTDAQQARAAELAAAGLVRRVRGRWAATRDGQEVLNQVVLRILSGGVVTAAGDRV